jgi:murein DD-endopeptidase MepM/ murein hydrolase activator NlpD
MIEVPGRAPARIRWSRRGRIAAAGLAFVCFITVLDGGRAARAASDPGIGDFARFKVPTEDQIRAEPLPSVVPKRPDRILQVCPVDRPRRYIDDFGDARWGGGFHRHQGNDIMAPHGTPIRAPFDGRAEKSISSSGGLGVYVYGKRGFVFNAHLARFGKLGKVKGGDVIGYVGNSGNARGTSSHDHFEWHPGGGPAVSPFPFLNEACRGLPTRAKQAPEPDERTPSVQ